MLKIPWFPKTMSQKCLYPIVPFCVATVFRKSRRQEASAHFATAQPLLLKTAGRFETAWEALLSELTGG